MVVPVVDIRGLFESRSRDGIPGRQLLIDHVHPTIHGHQLISDVLIDALVNLGIVVPRVGWRSQRQQVFRAHLGSLDMVYFEAGKERLRGLRNWAAGRSQKLEAEELGGPDYISFNLFRLSSGEVLLKPCEMPRKKVIDFITGVVAD